jgi:hypothetical protein
MNMQIAKLISIFQYLLVALILCVACTSDKGGGPPDGPGGPENNIVWVDTVSTIAGNHVKVDVYAMVATRSLGVRLPLKLSSNGLEIDSVSFRGTMLAQEPITGSVVIGSSGETVSIVREYLESDIIEPDSGVLVSLHITLDDTLTAQIIEVDTTIGNLWFTNDRGVQSVPEFTPGMIHVSEKSSGRKSSLEVFGNRFRCVFGVFRGNHAGGQSTSESSERRRLSRWNHVHGHVQNIPTGRLHRT